MLSSKKCVNDHPTNTDLFPRPYYFFSGNLINNVLCFCNVFFKTFACKQSHVLNRSALQTRVNGMGSCMPSSFISIEFVQIPYYKDKTNFIRSVTDTCTWGDVSKMHNNHQWEEYWFFGEPGHTDIHAA